MTAQHQLAAERIGRATTRLAQLQARQLLQDMRKAPAARARERKLVARRRFVHGEAVETAGLGDWSNMEVLGLLLLARQHFGESTTSRRLMEARAQDHMDGRPVRGAQCDASPTAATRPDVAIH